MNEFMPVVFVSTLPYSCHNVRLVSNTIALYHSCHSALSALSYVETLLTDRGR